MMRIHFFQLLSTMKINLVAKIMENAYLCAISGSFNLISNSRKIQDQRLSTEGKIVSKYCNISKTLGRGSIHNSPPLYHCGSMRINPINVIFFAIITT